MRYLFLLFLLCKALAQNREIIYEDFFIENDTLYIIKRIVTVAADSIYEIKILKSSGADSFNLNNYSPRLLCIFDRGGYEQGVWWNGSWYLSGWINMEAMVKKRSNGNDTILFKNNSGALQVVEEVIEEKERSVGILMSLFGVTVVIFENDTLLFPPLPSTTTIPRVIKKGREIFVPTLGGDFINDWQKLSILDLDNKNLKTIITHKVPFFTLIGICHYNDKILVPLLNDSTSIFIVAIGESNDTIATINLPADKFKVIEGDITTVGENIIFIVGGMVGSGSSRYYLYTINNRRINIHFLHESSFLPRVRIRKTLDGSKLFILAGEYIYIYDNITKVETTEIENIKNFELYQNYPNPFNSTTTIKYAIPASVNNATLKIYNILGQEILFKKVTPRPGIYELKFDASNLPTGVYFCFLEVDGKVVKGIKMILIK